MAALCLRCISNLQPLWWAHFLQNFQEASKQLAKGFATPISPSYFTSNRQIRAKRRNDDTSSLRGIAYRLQEHTKAHPQAARVRGLVLWATTNLLLRLYSSPPYSQTAGLQNMSQAGYARSRMDDLLERM